MPSVGRKRGQRHQHVGRSRVRLGTMVYSKSNPKEPLLWFRGLDRRSGESYVLYRKYPENARTVKERKDLREMVQYLKREAKKSELPLKKF